MMWLNSSTAVESEQPQGAGSGSSAASGLPPAAGASAASTSSGSVVPAGPARERSISTSDAEAASPEASSACDSVPRPISPRSLTLEKAAAAGAAGPASGHHEAHATPSATRPRISSFMWLTPSRVELLKGEHHLPAPHQQQQQQHQQQQKNMLALAQAALTVQRWFRHLREQWQRVRHVQEVLPAHLLPLLQASEGLGVGPWGWEWGSLCQEDRGLVGHAMGVLVGLGVDASCRAVDHTTHPITQPETLLSALLIAAHPEVVSPSSSSRKKRRRRGYERKSAALAEGALRVRNMLVELHYSLQQAGAPQWALVRIIRQTKHALAMFAVQREHYRGITAAETGGLAEELTKAATDVLEALARTDREMQQQQQQQAGVAAAGEVPVACEEAIRKGVAKLSQLDEALQHLVGRAEAVRRMETARAAAKRRLEEGGAMDVVSEHGSKSGAKKKKKTTKPGLEVEKKASTATASLVKVGRASDDGVTSPESLYSNEWLVHEICVLPHGRFLQVSLEDAAAAATDGSSNTTSTTSNATEPDGGVEAYWASVTRTLLAGDYTPLLVLVQELGERLISITPSRGDLAEEVQGALDVALLEQVLAKDVLDSKLLFSMLRFAGERVLWLEAPARNESTEDWLEDLNNLEAEVMAEGGGSSVRLSVRGEDVAGGDWAPLISPLFEFLLEKVDQIHVDIFNSHVRRATPHCRAHGPTFERQRFEERVAQGQTSLDRTRAWLASVLRSDWCAAQALQVKDYRYGVQSLSLVEGLRQNREDALRLLVRRAYCALLGDGPVLSTQAMGGYDAEATSTTPVLYEGVVPETLAMDAHRLDVARRVLLCVARAATLVAYLGQALCRSLGVDERLEVVQGLMVLLPEEAVSAEDICLHVGHVAGKLGLGDAAARRVLEERARHLLREGQCPVLRLLYQRGVEAVHSVLSKDGVLSAEETQAMRQECQQRGLLGLEGWIVKVSESLLLICRHNEAAFLPVYQRLALAEAVVEEKNGMVVVVVEGRE